VKYVIQKSMRGLLMVGKMVLSVKNGLAPPSGISGQCELASARLSSDAL
jgi:hypothetical protein